MAEEKKTPTFGELLIGSMEQAVAIKRGELEPARRTRVRTTARASEVAPPPSFDAREIRAVRDRLALSQPVFAQALGVSVPTVRAWEQGKREPEPAARRLLQIAKDHPNLLLEHVKPAKRSRR